MRPFFGNEEKWEGSKGSLGEGVFLEWGVVFSKHHMAPGAPRRSSTIFPFLSAPWFPESHTFSLARGWNARATAEMTFLGPLSVIYSLTQWPCRASLMHRFGPVWKSEGSKWGESCHLGGHTSSRCPFFWTHSLVNRAELAFSTTHPHAQVLLSMAHGTWGWIRQSPTSYRQCPLPQLEVPSWLPWSNSGFDWLFSHVQLICLQSHHLVFMPGGGAWVDMSKNWV